MITKVDGPSMKPKKACLAGFPSLSLARFLRRWLLRRLGRSWLQGWLHGCLFGYFDNTICEKETG